MLGERTWLLFWWQIGTFGFGIILTIAGASGFVFADRPQDKQKYQLTASSDGKVYRMDNTSGDIWLIDGNDIKKVGAREFILRVGKTYEAEDAYSLTYVGNGQMGGVKPTVEKRRPGETIPEYLKRTGQK